MKSALKTLYKATLYSPLKWFERASRKGIFLILELFMRDFNPFKSFGVPSKVVKIGSEEVYPPFVMRRTLPITVEKNLHQNFKQLEANSASGKITTLPFALATETAAHLTSKGEMVAEFTEYFPRTNLNEHKLFNFKTKRLSLPLYHKKGSVLSLVADCHWNYYHYLLDVLPKIHLAQKTNVPFDFVYTKYSAPFHKQSLRRLGIKDEQIIDADKHHYLSADSMILTSFMCLGATPNWVIHFLRESFINKTKNTSLPEKIYISRKGADYRRVVNEEQLLTELEKEGFVSLQLENLPMQDQVAYFNSAKVVVAPHGAGLTNLVFCQPQTQVIEFIPPRYPCSCFWALSNTVKLNYTLLLGEDDPSTYNPHCEGDDHILIDIAKVMQTIKEMS